MDEPHPGKTTFMIMVSPLPGKYELLVPSRRPPSLTPYSKATVGPAAPHPPAAPTPAPTAESCPDVAPGPQPPPHQAPGAKFGPCWAACSGSHNALLTHICIRAHAAPPLRSGPSPAPLFSAQSPTAGPSPTRWPRRGAARALPGPLRGPLPAVGGRAAPELSDAPVSGCAGAVAGPARAPGETQEQPGSRPRLCGGRRCVSLPAPRRPIV
ncbi:unnamed protein product [Lepidochelys kempii]